MMITHDIIQHKFIDWKCDCRFSRMGRARRFEMSPFQTEHVLACLYQMGFVSRANATSSWFISTRRCVVYWVFKLVGSMFGFRRLSFFVFSDWTDPVRLGSASRMFPWALVHFVLFQSTVRSVGEVTHVFFVGSDHWLYGNGWLRH